MTFAIKILSLFLATVFLISCSSSSKPLLCEKLFADYDASVIYTIKGDGDIISGKALVSKDDGVTLKLASPDIFEGITIKNGNDSPQTLFFSYYGMDAELPKGSLFKINLLLSLFSDMIPSRLSARGGYTITEVEDYVIGEKTRNVCRADASIDEISYSVIFDSITGAPYEMSATKDGVCAAAVIEELSVKKD